VDVRPEPLKSGTTKRELGLRCCWSEEEVVLAQASVFGILVSSFAVTRIV
jgi:hypothetical protein